MLKNSSFGLVDEQIRKLNSNDLRLLIAKRHCHTSFIIYLICSPLLVISSAYKSTLR